MSLSRYLKTSADKEIWFGRGSGKIKDLLLRVISDKILSYEQIGLDDPNWVVKRANYDGRVACLKELINLLQQEKLKE